MASNGFLSASELAPIAGGGYLRKDAAAAWNAMAAYIYEVEGVRIQVTGPDSAYRPYDRQVYWRNYWCGQGNCGNAAIPGYSNHGDGIATDVPSFVRALIDKYGEKFGFAKKWSDAPGEWWHIKWNSSIWHGPDPGPDGQGGFTTLRRGDHGDGVRRAQKALRRWNGGLVKPDFDGDFGKTTYRAVKQFQIVHGLKPDGVIGPATWKILRERDPLHPEERRHINKIRLARHNGVTVAEQGLIARHRDACADAARHIADLAKKDGWAKDHRRYRYNKLKKIAGNRLRQP